MISDWAAAKEIWSAIKKSEFSISQDLIVYVGIGPDGRLDVLVHNDDELTELEAEVEQLQDQVRELESMLREVTRTVQTESHIEPFLMTLRTD